MMRFLKWLGIALGALVALTLLAALAVYVIGGRIFARTYDVPAPAVTLPADSLAAARGERMARTRGCFGCHGSDLGGEVLFDEPGVGRLVAANLSRLVPSAGDAQLARAIRLGVRVDGRSVFAMPSPMFYHLSDADLGDLLAFLRTVPPVPDSLPPSQVRFLGRLGLVLNQYQPLVREIDTTVAYPAVTPREPAEALGRYVALTSCTECHGLDLEGEGSTPSLRIVGGYSADDFSRLMRTGVPLGGRKLDLMEEVALGRFAHLTDDEVAALYAYLKNRTS
jgi:mono/diheme cytochrome c family protein